MVNFHKVLGTTQNGHQDKVADILKCFYCFLLNNLKAKINLSLITFPTTEFWPSLDVEIRLLMYLCTYCISGMGRFTFHARTQQLSIFRTWIDFRHIRWNLSKFFVTQFWIKVDVEIESRIIQKYSTHFDSTLTVQTNQFKGKIDRNSTIFLAITGFCTK